MELDPHQQPPATNVWRPEWIPPFCPAECRNQCPAIFGVWTYTMNVFHAQPYFDTTTFRTRYRDVIHVGATEWYFDRYGCRKAAPEAAAQIAGGAVATTVFLSGTIGTFELAPYWAEARQALARLGVPPAGHVRVLPRIANGITALAFAASR